MVTATTAGPIQVHQVLVRVVQHPLLIMPMPMAIICLRPRQSICNILIQPLTNTLIKGIIGRTVSYYCVYTKIIISSIYICFLSLKKLISQFYNMCFQHLGPDGKSHSNKSIPPMMNNQSVVGTSNQPPPPSQSMVPQQQQPTFSNNYQVDQFGRPIKPPHNSRSTQQQHRGHPTQPHHSNRPSASVQRGT